MPQSSFDVEQHLAWVRLVGAKQDDSQWPPMQVQPFHLSSCNDSAPTSATRLINEPGSASDSATNMQATTSRVMEPNAPCDHPLWNLGSCALSIRPYIVTSTGHDARTVNGQPLHQGCSWRYPPYSVVHRGYEANLGPPSCSTSKMYSCTRPT
jgi:hypothetical protein